MADIFRETFESDGNGTRYTTSLPEFSNGSEDFFTRTNGTNIAGSYSLLGAEGDFVFAAMDIDGQGASASQTLTFSGIDITGASTLLFEGLFAEDDAGDDDDEEEEDDDDGDEDEDEDEDEEQDWDADTSLIVSYSIDGGAHQPLLAFEAIGGTNTAPAQDTDFDGLGDGPRLTDSFTRFTAVLPQAGSTLDLMIAFNNFNAGDEDVAIDTIALTGDFTVSTPTDLFISEYIEGSSNNKAIEIYNGTGAAIDLTAGGYQLAFYFNGNTSPSTTIDLDGVVAAGDVWVVADNDADQAILDETDQQSNSSFFNGDDAIVLLKGGVVLDVIGQIGFDPGSEWNVGGVGTQNETIRRNADVTEGDTDGSDAFDPSAEFTSFANNSFDDLGSFTGFGGGGGGGGTPTLSIADVTLAEGDSGTTTMTFTVTLSDEVTGGLSVDVATADATATAGVDYTATDTTLAFAGTAGETQTVTVELLGDVTPESDETFTITLSDGGDLNGAVISASAGSATGTIANDDIPLELISTVQGDGAASDMVGDVVTLEAIVVGDFQDGDADNSRNLRGFFLQEEDADADANALTSEGIFVFDNSFGTDVNVGDKVQVTGTVAEFFGETQLSNITNVTVISSGNTLPTAANITLPAAGTITDQAGDLAPDLEAFEGMLVSFTDTLTVSEMFQLDRFGEIKLVQGDRPYQFTQQNAPDAAGYQAYLEELGARTITYDDGLSQQNALIENLDGFGTPFSTANAVSMGDTIDNLTGVLSYQWAGNSSSQATWRVRATEDGENTFVDTNPRDATPEDVGGSLKVASFNVLNYFTTIDVSGASTANGNDPRGADTVSEFNRQTEKLVTAISAMDADVIGLIELENDFGMGSAGNAIANLVAELNLAGGTWDWVNPGQQFVGSDAIANGFIYNTATVEIKAGSTVEILEDSDLATLGITPVGNGIFDGSGTNRPVVAASFTELASGQSFTAAVNHFKSKGSLNETNPDNADAGDGAGRNNGVRLEASIALDAWLATDPTNANDDDFLILGDLNAYAQEDPVTYLAGQGYTDLAQSFIGSDAYGYVFDGQIGTLDYAMANGSLFDQVTGATEWHINSDEADAIDYNEDFGRDSAIFDGSEPYRASDHDPVIVGLDLSTTVGFNGEMLAVNSFSTRDDKGDVMGVAGGGIELTNNAWKAVDLDYTITADTVLTLEYKANDEGEVHGIGFANDGRVTGDTFFKFAGTQRFGWENAAWEYDIDSGYQTLEIRVGDYVQGDFDSFVFVMDDDANLGGNGLYRNITLSEQPLERTITIFEADGITGTDYEVGSFSRSQDKGDADIDANGALTLTNNAWKSIDIDLDVTSETVLEFDFKVDAVGEIHAIGFASDGVVDKDNAFNLAGIHGWGLNSPDWEHTPGSGTETITIDVGEYFTGQFDELVFIMDDDQGLGGDATFSNISIYEDLGIV